MFCAYLPGIIICTLFRGSVETKYYNCNLGIPRIQEVYNDGRNKACTVTFNIFYLRLTITNKVETVISNSNFRKSNNMV